MKDKYIKRKRNKFIILGLNIFLIILTLILLFKEYSKIYDSEAAIKKNLVFTTVGSESLNNPQKAQYQKFSKSKISDSSMILSLYNKDQLVNADSVTIPINGATITLSNPVVEKNKLTNATFWKSHIESSGIELPSLFTYADNHLVGSIQVSSDKSYDLKEIDDNLFMLIETPEGIGIKDDVNIPNTGLDLGNLTEAEEITNAISSQNPTPKVIRIILPYDPHAREYFKLPNGTSAVVAEVTHAAELAIEAFGRSGVIHEFRIVQVYEMSGSVSELNVDYIQDNREIFVQLAIRAIQTNADVAILSVKRIGDGTLCGRAGAMPQQNVDFMLKRIALVDYTCFVGNHVFAHEIGHLFGADHDRANSVMGGNGTNNAMILEDYIEYEVNELGDLGTIMSYVGRHLPGDYNVFSNPRYILPNGTPFGDPEYADNVSAINSYGPVVAGYSWGSSGTGSSGGTKGCGEVCANASQCQNGFYCLDISANTAGNECWNESMCIVAPPRNRRISGKVLDCNGNPKANVKVATKGFSFNKSANTNSQGIFQIWETNNECSVDKDTGQTFAVLAGKDADSNQTDFYGRVASPVFSKPEINCGNVNCNYTGNQASGGPNRQNYHLSVSAFVNNPNVYNTYVCEEDGNFLSGFDFKQVNCPVATPTPAPLTCNSVCTSDAQCSSSNSNWYCSTQFSYGGWSDISNNVGSIQYKVGNNIYTDSGTTTGFNKALMNDGVIEQHLVKGGKVYSNRYTPSTGWDQYWTDSTSNIPSTIPGTTIDFNSYRKPNGKIEQHLIKTSGSTNKVYTQNNEQGWGKATWVDVTISSNILVNTGTGPVTGFTAHVDKDGYIIQNMVRGGQLWERNNIGGWANATWRNITTGLNGCAGVGANKCGNATLLTVERNRNNENKDEFFLIRAGGKMYHRVSTPTDKRCRLKANPYTPTCSIQ